MRFTSLWGRMASTSCLSVALATGAMAGPVPTSSKSAKDPVVTPDDFTIALGTFNTGVKTSDVYTEGNISLVVPIINTFGADGTLEGDLVFITPYTSLGEGGELANSLGLGWRHLFSNQSVRDYNSAARPGFLTEGFYVGVNAFVDNLTTQYDNDFWQAGVGFEIGSRYLELRGNYYLPFDGSQKLADRTVDTRTFTSKSRSSRSHTTTQTQQSGTPVGEPVAVSNTIQQDVNLTEVSTTLRHTTTSVTTTKTTVRTITSLFEEGMEGWDAEIAMLIPGLDEHLEVSVLAGYYSFDNQPFGPQDGGSGKTEGFKLGLEVRPVPAVVLTATWYEDEGLTGSDWVVGAGLQIPLGKEWKDAFKPRRRHLLERLGEPVARQNAAIKTSLSYDIDQQAKQTSTTNTSTSTAVVQQTVTNHGSRRLVIQEDIIFVNNGGPVGNGIMAGSPTGNGTAERPLDTVQAGADKAAVNNVATQRIWNVYTQGGAAAYAQDGPVQVTGSTNFISSAIKIPAFGNTSFGSGHRPVVNHGFNVVDVGYFGLHGYQVQGGYSVDFFYDKSTAVGLNNVSKIEITNNIIKDYHGASEGGYGAGVFVVNSAPYSALIANNVFQVDPNADASIIGVEFGGMMLARGIGPMAMPSGIVGDVSIVVADNQFYGQQRGVSYTNYGHSGVLDITITGNKFESGLTYYDDIYVSDNHHFEGALNLNIANNTFGKVGAGLAGKGSTGVRLDVNSGDQLDISIANNAFHGVSNGVSASLYFTDKPVNFTVANNTMINTRFGINLYGYYLNGGINAQYNGNTITNAATGISSYINNSSSVVKMTASGNKISSSSAVESPEGILMTVEGIDMDARITVVNNTLSDLYRGVSVSVSNVDVNQVVLSGNAFNRIAAEMFDLGSSQTSIMNVTSDFNNKNSATNSASGVHLIRLPFGPASGTIHFDGFGSLDAATEHVIP